MSDDKAQSGDQWSDPAQAKTFPQLVRAAAAAYGDAPAIRLEGETIPSEAASTLCMRIGQARTLRELWHLRAELYNVVALHHSQQEAERRLAELNRHFPTRAPRSQLAPL